MKSQIKKLLIQQMYIISKEVSLFVNDQILFLSTREVCTKVSAAMSAWHKNFSREFTRHKERKEENRINVKMIQLKEILMSFYSKYLSVVRSFNLVWSIRNVCQVKHYCWSYLENLVHQNIENKHKLVRDTFW